MKNYSIQEIVVNKLSKIKVNTQVKTQIKVQTNRFTKVMIENYYILCNEVCINNQKKN